ATNVNNQAGLLIVEIQTGAQGGGEAFVDQVNPSGLRILRGVFHRTSFERRRRTRHPYDQTASLRMIMMLHPADQRAQKHLRDFKIVDGAALDRPMNFSVIWLATEQLQRLGS